MDLLKLLIFWIILVPSGSWQHGLPQIYLASFYAYALREPLVTHTLEMAVLHRMISIQVTIT